MGALGQGFACLLPQWHADGAVQMQALFGTTEKCCLRETGSLAYVPG